MYLFHFSYFNQMTILGKDEKIQIHDLITLDLYFSIPKLLNEYKLYNKPSHNSCPP